MQSPKNFISEHLKKLDEYISEITGGTTILKQMIDILCQSPYWIL